MAAARREWAFVLAVALLGLLLRFCIGIHPYSGKGVAPKFGDYEAQRHWMELTINLPPLEWYRETADNDLGYWGIDYPPLSAYQSWICGKAIACFEPEAVELGSSRGYETPSSKLLMRLSVIFFDLTVFLPAMLAAVHTFCRKASRRQRRQVLALAILQPAALVIDHGHFQYNNIGLGLSAAAAAAIAADRQLLGSCLFCLALNHKQMAMYYAPAFFAHLLGRALQRPTTAGKAWHVAKLGAVVLATFAAAWAPFLASKDAAMTVLQRLVPLQRGLFEDYVANFWCVTSLGIKWKHLFSQQALVRMTTCCTLLGFLPSVAHQLWRPSRRGLLYCMANCAFSFFLFSFQVHEKSVLLPLLPLVLLAGEEPLLAGWLQVAACFSMFPLLKRDSLATAYGALQLAAAAATAGRPTASSDGQKPASVGKWERALRGTVGPVITASVMLGMVIHVLHATYPPPQKLPFLYDAMFVALPFLHLLSAALYLNLKQWRLPA